MFSSLWSKITGAAMLLLAGAAAFFKWRADANAAKAEKSVRRAQALETRVKDYQTVSQRQASVDEVQKARQARERHAEAKGKRGGFNNHWVLLVALLVPLIGGCAAAPAGGSLLHDCPTRPTLPAVSAAEVAPLSDTAYHKLMLRERLLREYAEDLEVYCSR